MFGFVLFKWAADGVHGLFSIHDVWVTRSEFFLSRAEQVEYAAMLVRPSDRNHKVHNFHRQRLMSQKGSRCTQGHGFMHQDIDHLVYFCLGGNILRPKIGCHYVMCNYSARASSI
jgi:hypothetical protein